MLLATASCAHRNAQAMSFWRSANRFVWPRWGSRPLACLLLPCWQLLTTPNGLNLQKEQGLLKGLSLILLSIISSCCNLTTRTLLHLQFYCHNATACNQKPHYGAVKAMYLGKDFKGDPPLYMKIAAGLTTGAIAIAIASPTDLVKVRPNIILPWHLFSAFIWPASRLTRHLEHFKINIVEAILQENWRLSLPFPSILADSQVVGYP